MAERDRRRERRLRYIEAELRHGRERLEYWTSRVRELEQAQSGLGDGAEAGGGEQSGGGGPGGNPGGGSSGTGNPGGGGIADLFKSIKPETMQKIGEAMQGIDLQPILGALSGGGAAPRLGALGGGGGAPDLASLAGMLSSSGDKGGSPLDGLSEVADFFTKNPLKGKKWSLKDVPSVLKLISSPNVRALIRSAQAAANLARAGSQVAPLLASLSGGDGSGGRTGQALPPAAAAEGGAAQAGLPAGPQPVRFSRPQGPPPVVEPWTGGPSGRWVWVEESAGA